VFTVVATIFLSIVAYLTIGVVYVIDPYYGGVATVVSSYIFSVFVKRLMTLELHHSESTRETWLFLKVFFFNIFTTTMLLFFLYPFTATLDNIKTEGSATGLIPSIFSLLFSQLLFTPALQIADIYSNYCRHVLAPRAKTQEQMNMYMMGTEVFLAERYAELIKYIYLVLFYCVLFPAGFFVGSFALGVVYLTDRFSLMRSWARRPRVGTQIADFARRFFISGAVFFMAYSSLLYWRNFPFDNLCKDNSTELHSVYADQWTIDIPGDSLIFGPPGKSTPVVFNISLSDQVYKYCNQQFDISGSWQTSDQKAVVKMSGAAWLIVLILVLVIFMWRFFNHLREYCQGTHKHWGADQNIPFSNVETIDSYIPQVCSFEFAHPLILCDVQGIDECLFNWNDPDRPRRYYDITVDAKAFLDGTSLSKSDFLFSRVRHWSPHDGGDQCNKYLVNVSPDRSKSTTENNDVDLNLGDSPTDKGLSPTVVPERSGWYSSVPDIISTFGCW